MQKSAGTYFARAHVQGDGSISQERMGRLRSKLQYRDRGRLLGCRANQFEAHPHSSTRAGLSLSLARLSPQKASTGNKLQTISVFPLFRLCEDPSTVLQHGTYD